MLTGIHFILTYTCNFECDHCFLYCSPKSKGPEYGFKPRAGYVDECHLCYLVRKANMGQFPDYLSPKQVYGLE